MTIRAYISDKLRAFGLTEAQLVDMSLSSQIDFNEELTGDNQKTVSIAIIGGLEELVLAPRMTNVNESGFSMSWDFENVGKYYLWLCRKWGVTPNDEVLTMLGLSTITDRTDVW